MSPPLSPTGHSFRASGDVVAGLVNNVMASAVGAAAVREAVARGARIRFLQVLPPGLSAEEHTEMVAVLFNVALKSLHRMRRTPCTFETVVGSAAQMLVERSRNAALLVLGADEPGGTVAVAAYCQEHCACDVLVVSEPLQSSFVAEATQGR